MSSKRTANQNVSFSVSLCVFRRVLPWLTALFDFFQFFTRLPAHHGHLHVLHVQFRVLKR